MIPSDLAARLRALTDASFFDSEPPIQGTARVRELQARLPELLPGQQFSATLQRPLPDGTFQALVGGRSYTLALNHSAKPGDTLELVVTKNAANVVFAQLANPAGAGAEASQSSLSPTGKLISFLLTGQPTPQPAQLADGKPLTNLPPPSAAQGAAAHKLQNAATDQASISAALLPRLKQALSQSGLFYEAHQVRWLSGQLRTADLMREPQAQLTAQPSGLMLGAGAPGAMAAGAGGLSGMSGTLAGLLLGMGVPAGGEDTASNQSPRTAEAGGQAANRTAGNERAALNLGSNAADEAESNALDAAQRTAQNRAGSVPERLFPIVHQQLDGMATQQYLLQGQAWPGQPFQWLIEDPYRDPGGQGGGDDEPESWNTTLKITLPMLGGVEARIQLTAAGLGLRLVADEATTVDALQAAQDQLDSALEAAAVPLTAFVVERRDGD